MGLILQKQDKKDEQTVHFSLVDTKNLLLIFTRNPELGKCKTRLAATVGNQTALDIYKFLLNHTVALTTNLTIEKQVWYSEDIWNDDIWDNTIFDKKLQKGENLGERMAHAFQEGFEKGFKKIVIIGSDMYDLNQEALENAFISMNNSDFVLGPATDGGYYLLGMKKWNPKLFKNKDWGQNTVLEDTLNDLKHEKVKLLDVKNDVDVYEDIEHIAAFQPFLKKSEK